MKHLAFDLGAESGRAIVGEITDGKLRLEEIYRFATQGLYVNGSMHWDVYRLFDELKTGLKKYAQKYGPELDSIGVDTWGVDFGLFDSRGKLIGVPYHYRDARTEGTDKIIEEKLGKARVYEITGIQFLSINTLNQMVSMRRDDDPSLNMAKHMMFMGDLLHYFLSGVVCAEYTLASISQMYDTTRLRWSDEIFDAFDIPKTLQTRVVQAGDQIGSIRGDVARETGISQDTRIIAPAVHDTASAFAAVPAQGKNWGCISSGTWSLCGIEIDKPITSPVCYEMNISNSGGALGKTLFLKNVMGLWIIQQCKKAWHKKMPALDYPEIVACAQQAKPFAGVIDPEDGRFLNPLNAPEAINDYLKSTDQPEVDPGDVGQIARIVFESLAFKYRYVFDKLAAATGHTIDTLHVMGGGCKNEMLNQFTANALNVPVVAGPTEATAAGNLLMQAYGASEVGSLDQLRRVVFDSFELKRYEPNNQDAWKRAYQSFLSTCKLKSTSRL